MRAQNWKPIDFEAINMMCRPRLTSLVPAWLPNGYRQGAEWCALNPTRDDQHIGSFSINMDTGCWADFASNDVGGDPISLYAYLNDLTQSDAARALSDLVGGVA